MVGKCCFLGSGPIPSSLLFGSFGWLCLYFCVCFGERESAVAFSSEESCVCVLLVGWCAEICETTFVCLPSGVFVHRAMRRSFLRFPVTTKWLDRSIDRCVDAASGWFISFIHTHCFPVCEGLTRVMHQSLDAIVGVACVLAVWTNEQTSSLTSTLQPIPLAVVPE